MSTNYTPGDVIDVRIEKIVPRGFGLAFAEKLTILIPLASPGDVLRVRLGDIKKRLAFASIVEVLEPGPHRITPPCPYFGTCGGCDFQQLSYEAQLLAKVGIIRDCLHRIGKIEYEGEIPIIASPQEFGYRSRARWHAKRETRFIGYYERDSHNVIDIAACPIITPGLQRALESVRQSTNWDAVWSDKAEIEAASDDDAGVSIFSSESSDATSELTFAMGDTAYAYSAETFFQANKALIGELIAATTGGLSGETAFDLYAGVGLFAIPLARQFEKVVMVEDGMAAIGFAKKNVNAAGLGNVKIVGSSVSGFLRENQKKKIDLILIDPPRSGTEKQTIPTIAALKPAHISYVSCEPSILARDLRVLLDAGYTIDKITALDLFPQTHHVETVVRLKRS